MTIATSVSAVVPKGFTLIEVMIVVAILGIVASIAIPAYTGYLNTSRIAKVTDHVDTAVRWVTAGFKSNVTRRSMNITYVAANEMGAAIVAAGNNEFPRASANLNNALNGQPAGVGDFQGSSPEQGLTPYATVPNAAAGQVGVAVNITAGGWTTGDNVTITQPAYLDLPANIITVIY